MKKILLSLFALILSSTATTAAERIAYAALSEENTVLTFYYDDKMEERDGTSYLKFSSYDDANRWKGYWAQLTTVVFDESFRDCTSIVSTRYWFYACRNLKTIKGVSNFNTSHVTDMGNMFESCTSLESLDLNSFDTGKVTNMCYMFAQCSSLKSLDLSSFNTASVENMSRMFRNCSSLTSLSVSSFNTENVRTMEGMFDACAVYTLDLSNFNTLKVTNMRQMFYASALTTVDLTSFDTTNVTDFYGMFNSCRSLKTIYAQGNWSVDKNETMFYGCTNLVGGKGTTYQTFYNDGDYARIDGGVNAPGYFTDKTDTSIKNTLHEANHISSSYTLSGISVQNPNHRAIYIKDGKKKIVR